MSLAHKFPAALRRARTNRRLTMGELAARAGICIAYVSFLEAGKRSPALGTIDALARALRVNPLSLLKS